MILEINGNVNQKIEYVAPKWKIQMFKNLIHEDNSYIRDNGIQTNLKYCKYLKGREVEEPVPVPATLKVKC